MIRWITEDLGTAPYLEVQAIPAVVLDVRSLVDRVGNSQSAIKDLLDSGVAALRRGERVVVACDLGISRSNAIAAGILSLFHQKPFDWAIAQVVARTEEKEIKLEVAEAIRSVLDKRPKQEVRNKILVTGAAGFLGRSLLGRLGDNASAMGVTRDTVDLEAGTHGLAEYCRQSRVGQIVHLAYPRVVTNISASGSSLVMMRTVLDVCRLLGIHLVVASSAAVFSGASTRNYAAAEDSLPQPKGIHGDTKFLEETLANLYSRRGEVDLSICRFTSLFGRGCERPRFMHNFYSSIVRGQNVVTHSYRNGNPALDLLNVDDAADGLVRVLRSRALGIFHFGTGELRSTIDIAVSLGRLAGQRPDLSSKSIEDDVCNVCFPARSARTVLEWQPLVSFEDGLRSVFDAQFEGSE